MGTYVGATEEGSAAILTCTEEVSLKSRLHCISQHRCTKHCREAHGSIGALDAFGSVHHRIILGQASNVIY